MKKLLTSILALLAITVVFAQEQSSILNNIESYANKVKAEWNISGMAISIIQDGEMVYAKGFGHKDLTKPDLINENTIFQIGSVSKSFTAALMASLVDEGLVSWEDTVKNILPDFKMYDKWVEENMQVKDLMTHRTGLKGQAGTYIPNLGYGREDIYQMLQYIKPAYSFRGGYQYNNITFIIAGKIIEKLTSKTWEENIQSRILDPLGMTATTMNGDAFKSATNVATPHTFYYNKKKDAISTNSYYGDEQALHWLTVVGPAGSINSSVVDMTKWIDFHLNLGKVAIPAIENPNDSTVCQHKQIISEKSMKYLRKGLTITSQNEERTTLYGHCWFVEQNNKYRVYFHTGTTWGMTAICFFVPELNLGGMILCNSEVSSSPRYAIMRRIIDQYMGQPDVDYSEESYSKWIEDKRKKAKEPKEKKEIIEAPNFKALIGNYHKDEPFGPAKVELEKGKLYMTIGKMDFKRELKHINGNLFHFRSDGHSFPIEFTLDEKGKSAISFEVDFGEKEDFGPWKILN